MAVRIEQWSMNDARLLEPAWAAATIKAPYAYSVTSEEFARGIVPDLSDKESLATDRSQKLLAGIDKTDHLGFAHLSEHREVEVDGENIHCGVIRFLAFPAGRPDVGQSLLSYAEQTFSQDGLVHIDAFPLYHGYPFHNHKVGMLSDRMMHATALLKEAGYVPHDAHLTLNRHLDKEPLPPTPLGAEVTVERTNSPGPRPNIWIKAHLGDRTIGNCRSVSGTVYANDAQLDDCCYTRWLNVAESHRRHGFGSYLLRRALHEMVADGYRSTRLNCRGKNEPALELYQKLGYTLGDRSHAYIKDLGA